MKTKKLMETFHKKISSRVVFSNVLEKGLNKMEKKKKPFVLVTYNKLSKELILSGFPNKENCLGYLETLGYSGQNPIKSFHQSSNELVKKDVYVQHCCIGFNS